VAWTRCVMRLCHRAMLARPIATLNRFHGRRCWKTSIRSLPSDTQAVDLLSSCAWGLAPNFLLKSSTERRKIHRDGFTSCRLEERLAAASFEFAGTITFLLLGLGPIQAAAAGISKSMFLTSTGADAGPTPPFSIDPMMYTSAGLGLGLLVSACSFTASRVASSTLMARPPRSQLAPLAL